MAINVKTIATIKTWLDIEFLPLTLATPDDTITQIIENAIRYWNTHSAFSVIEMVASPASGSRVQLSANIKNVVQTIPGVRSNWILNDHPLWSLVGIQILDNISSDLIIMTEAFKNYRKYVGTDFRWKFVKSMDATAGGYLYVRNPPVGNNQLACFGTYRILDDDEITSDYIQDWIMRYSKAYLKETEGNILRKAAIVGVPSDGGDMVREGREEKKELQEKLVSDGRWVTFARRI